MDWETAKKYADSSTPLNTPKKVRQYRNRVDPLDAFWGGLRRGQARDSGFSSSFFSMTFCWRTASLDYSIRLAPRRIKSEALSG